MSRVFARDAEDRNVATTSVFGKFNFNPPDVLVIVDCFFYVHRGVLIVS